MIKLIPLAALAAGFLAAPVAAVAQTAPTTASVRHADLKLDTAEGVAKLDRRIVRAVEAACGTTASYDRPGQKAIEACRAETLASVTPSRDRIVAIRGSAVAVAAR